LRSDPKGFFREIVIINFIGFSLHSKDEKLGYYSIVSEIKYAFRPVGWIALKKLESIFYALIHCRDLSFFGHQEREFLKKFDP
jgi:hypothetical protein